MADRAVLLADLCRGTAEVGLTHIDRAAVYTHAGRFSDLPAVLAAARVAVDREGLRDMSEPWLATDEVDLLVWQDRWGEAEALATRTIDTHPSPSPRAWHHVVRGQLRVRAGLLAEGERDLRTACDIRPPVEPEIRAIALGHLAEAALIRADARAALAIVAEALAVLAPTDELPGRVHLLALGLSAAADLAERARARRDKAGEADAAGAAEPYVAGIRAAMEGPAGRGRRDRWPRRVARRVGPCGGGAPCRRRRPRRVGHRGDRAEGGRRAIPGGLDAVSRGGGRARGRGRPGACGGRSCARPGPGRLASAPCLFAARSSPWPGARGVTWPTPRHPSRRRLEDGHAAGPAHPYGLSPRERDVLALLVDGRTNREIGAALFISEKTASSHVTHILDKLGVSSRGAAAALAARGGLIGESEG